jgi:transcriptional regulator with XRE-family HTH domain
LAGQVGVSFTYLSRIENEKLDFGPYPSEDLICRLAEALEADPDELLILAKKVPEKIRRRVFERPDAFAANLEQHEKSLSSARRSRGEVRPSFGVLPCFVGLVLQVKRQQQVAGFFGRGW